MPSLENAEGSLRVLLLPPTVRDGEIAAAVLQQNGIDCLVCRCMQDFCEQAERGAGALLISEKRLLSDSQTGLQPTLEKQPPWSDIPVIVLTLPHEASVASLRIWQQKANVTLLPQPLRLDEFLAVVRSRLRDRKRQYVVKALLDRLDAANLAKSEFLANMSHEIRTPMTAILGYSELLLERESDSEKQDFVRVIKQNGGFLLEIINDILDLSKIEAGKLEISSELIDPRQFLNEIHSLMETRAGEKDILFRTLVDRSAPVAIRSDSKRLRQILVNLLGNAIKFTEQGSVLMSASYSDQKMLFVISDTGIGMSDEQIAKLFQPFQQGDTSVSRRFGGTGLGLAISQRLATMLGGRILVEGELGKGSVFTLELAVEEIGPSRQGTPPQTPKKHGGHATPDLAECRILVVDDRHEIRFLSGQILSKAGAVVDYAEDGERATKIVEGLMQQQCAPHLILIDMQMPVMDGYQATEKLREMGFASPIIALTADAMHGDMARCLQCGCDAYLSKPIDTSKLLRLVAQHIRPGSCT